ncbi:MAG: response regulator [Deltaproteobacteria bacterium]|nr:response regulator [Deltaproteobacteria bacterium]MBN2670196.1 response regulator [Deltaproteobacteria bacterium]
MKKVLVIDDDPFIRDVLKQTLERNSFAVTLADDGEEGLQKFATDSFDLVITDLIMPKKEGVETIAELKKIAPEVKIIAISGGYRLPAENYLKIASTLGVNGTLIKPFEKSELIAAVNKVLE